jgi:hypothetical protein
MDNSALMFLNIASESSQLKYPIEIASPQKAD